MTPSSIWTRDVSAPTRLTVLVLAGLLLLASPLARADTAKAPDFQLPGLDRERQFHLSDYRGSYVLVDFWAAWCPPCRQSLPFYDDLRQSLRQRFGKDAFEVLAINVDITAEEGRAFAAPLSLSYPLLRSDDGITQIKYNLRAMPSAFLVGPEGHLLYSFQGFSDQHADALRADLLERLQQR